MSTLLDTLVTMRPLIVPWVAFLTVAIIWLFLPAAIMLGLAAVFGDRPVVKRPPCPDYDPEVLADEAELEEYFERVRGDPEVLDGVVRSLG